MSNKENKKSTVLLIDYNNLILGRAVKAVGIDPTDNQFLLWKSIMMRSILKLLTVHNPTRVIFCMEGGLNWRKKFWTEYKSNRKNHANRSIVDFNALFQASNKFVESLKKYLPELEFFSVPGAEGDDLISILTKHFDELNIPVVCISSDRDFYQLYKYKNFKQWDPNKSSFKEYILDDNSLLIKIITGDRSDGIPGIKKRIGPRTALSIITSGNLEEWLEKEDLKTAFQVNRTLIDFDCIPQDITNKILDGFKELNYSSKTKNEEEKNTKLVDFIYKEGLWSIVDLTGDLQYEMSKLTPGFDGFEEESSEDKSE